MSTHDWNICNGDTDSLTFYKKDFQPFKKEEVEERIKELNTLVPDGLVWEDDGIFDTLIVIKAKNYVLYDGKKIKYKGASLVASTKEPALKEFINKVVECIVHESGSLEEIYSRYVIEATDIKDIRRWVSRRAITEAVMTSTRANETKILDALNGTEYRIGDRVYLYFKPDSSLSLAENFDGEYHKGKMLEKLYKTGELFSTILDTDVIFPNLALKKNRFILNDILGLTPEVTFKTKEL